MNAVVLQSHLRVNLELKKNQNKTKNNKTPTLDPMNAKIDLVTLNYVKKFSALKKKKVFRFADIAFCGHSYCYPGDRTTT